MVTRSALIYLSRQEGLKDFAARFRLFKRLTTRFVAGEDIDEAVAAIRELNAEGCGRLVVSQDLSRVRRGLR